MIISKLVDTIQRFVREEEYSLFASFSPKVELIVGNVLLGAFVIMLSNTGSLPLGMSDFLFFGLVFFFFALYRPGWTFLLLVGMLPYEIFNLVPASVGFMLRPYQFLAALLMLALFFLMIRKRSPVSMFRWRWFDTAIISVPLGGFLASVNAPDPDAAVRLAVILVSFFLLYLLGRLFIRDGSDVRIIAPFILSSAALVAFYGIFQNIRLLAGFDSFETMPGRPNATFSEPDWLGGFLVVIVASILAFWCRFAVGISSDDTISRVIKRMNPLFFFLLVLMFVPLLLSVSRSAWLGAFFAGVGAVTSLLFAAHRVKPAMFFIGGVIFSFFLGLVLAFPLTTFNLFGRAASTGGLQEITVSCDADVVLPNRISDVSELQRYGCRHINLEEIGFETSSGKFVTTVLRPDPSVEIRKNIYKIVWEKIREHPILGIGWGSIGAYLGMDERGMALNASNMFLEIWLGSGFVGFLGFLSVWLAIPIFAFRRISSSDVESRLPNRALSIFILSAWGGLSVFNLFNSGVLLGYFWIFLALSTIVLQLEKPRGL